MDVICIVLAIFVLLAETMNLLPVIKDCLRSAPAMTPRR